MSFRDKFGPRKAAPARVNRDDAPEGVRKLLLDLILEREQWDEEFSGYEFLCNILNEVPSDHWGNELQYFVRRAVSTRLDWPDVYDAISGIASFDQEERIGEVLAAEGMAYDFYGGEFHAYEPEADELEVTGIESQALVAGLDPEGRFAGPKGQYKKALNFLRSTPPDLPNAVASAVNALEGTVSVITGTKNISDGLKTLYAGERKPLGRSMEMLFAYGSTKDGVRHGARKGSDDLTIHEAAYIVRAAGSAIAYLIAADYEGTL